MLICQATSLTNPGQLKKKSSFAWYNQLNNNLSKRRQIRWDCVSSVHLIIWHHNKWWQLQGSPNKKLSRKTWLTDGLFPKGNTAERAFFLGCLVTFYHSLYTNLFEEKKVNHKDYNAGSIFPIQYTIALKITSFTLGANITRMKQYPLVWTVPSSQSNTVNCIIRYSGYFQISFCSSFSGFRRSHGSLYIMPGLTNMPLCSVQ